MRIVVVNQNWLGDVLFSTPALRALKKHFPDSHLACLAPSRVSTVLRSNPSVNEVIEYDDRASFRSPFGLIRAIAALRRRGFDRAYFFHRSKTKVWIAKTAGIRERYGYGYPRRDPLLTHACPPPEAPKHKIDYFLELLSYFGVASDGRHMDYSVSAAAEAAVWKKLDRIGIRAGEAYVTVHAGGNWDLKRWPVLSFAAWIRQFRRHYGWKIVLCGTAQERSLCEEILSHSGREGVASLCGETSIEELAALLKNSKLLLSNDSGPIHLAASQRTPLLGLFGPTSPERTGPVSLGPMRVLHQDVGCEVPCYFRSCDHRVCMELLSPDQVFQATVDLLSHA